ncbi:uncharacterized protein METZ01_LOCUS118189 [marine metagenome]|uniref:Uncharacterized protein n=1 Tax=marine metagenome TaxID=408172 RepID=A0A381XKP3_9ZZZZ|tara:strand:+ start:720 stop:1163 length:444 start_codon:yes stop_codon:yes gene_type:complete
MELEYPQGFPEDYQPQVDVVLVKAEEDYRFATKDLSTEQIETIEVQAIQFIESAVLVFATQCIRGGWQRDWTGEHIRRKVDTWLGIVSRVAYFQLLPSFRSDHFSYATFKKKAELSVIEAEGWSKHVKARESLSPSVGCVTSPERSP